MQTLNFICSNQVLTAACPGRLVIAKSKRHVFAKFVLDDEWDGLSVTALFRNEFVEDTYKRLITAEPVEIPQEVLVQGRLFVSLEGLKDGGEYRLTSKRMNSPVSIHRCGDLVGIEPGDQTPELWEQALALMGDVSNLDTSDKSSLVAAINEVRRTGGGGSGDGTPGENGGYYKPSVLQPDANTMRVSYMPSKDGMDNVPTFNVTLPTGPVGPTGPEGPTGPRGPSGVSVTSVTAAGGGNWLIRYSDGRTSTVSNAALTSAINNATSAASQANSAASRADIAAFHANQAVADLNDTKDGKVNKSGWNPNKYLGTDENGNVVEKKAPDVDVDLMGDPTAYYTPVITQPNGTGSMVVSYVASQEEMPAVDPVEVFLPLHEIDNHTLVVKNGFLQVNTTENVEEDNTLPITSAAVYATVGNISAILDTI